MVFDEADAGVGGATAAALGTLAGPGKTTQVLVITIPLITAAGHDHWHVSKSEVEGRTALRSLTIEE